jgi:phosphoglycolate phosphatase-like HAD superfamily hydrolase
MKNQEKFLVIFDADATLVNSEEIQGAFYREAFLRLFKNNPDAIRNLENTLCEDEEKCKEWYCQNLMGRLSKHVEVVSKNIAPINQEQMDWVNEYVDKRILESVGPDMIIDGAKDTLKCLSEMDNVDVCILSGGSAEPVAMELIKSGTFGRDVKISGFYTSEWLKKDGKRLEKHDMVKEIMKDRGITDASYVICVGDGAGDMKMGTDIDKKSANAWRIGFVGAFSSKLFKDKHAKMLLDNGADVVFDGHRGLLDSILSRIEKVTTVQAKTLSAKQYGKKDKSLSPAEFKVLAEKQGIKVL